jgi:VWFA-related protein
MVGYLIMALYSTTSAGVLGLLLAGALAAQTPASEPQTATPPASDEATATAPAPPTFAGQIEVNAVDLLIDVRDAQGNTPSDLRPADFAVVEDGVSCQVVAVDVATAANRGTAPAATSAPQATAPTAQPATVPAAAPAVVEPKREPWQVVLYFDLSLSAHSSPKQAAESLEADVDRLTDLGTVEVVVADPLPEMRLAPTRDRRAVYDALHRVAAKSSGKAQLTALRRQFVREMDQLDMGDEMLHNSYFKGDEHAGQTPGGGLPGSRPNSGGITISQPGVGGNDAGTRDPGTRGARQDMLIRGSVAQERRLLDRSRLLLTNWLAATARTRPRVLFLVNDGFDTDPSDFYLAQQGDSSRIPALRNDLAELRSSASFAEQAKLLAADGWIVYPVAVGGVQAASTMDASESGVSRVRSQAIDRHSFTGHVTSFLVEHPLEPLTDYAEESGGQVVVDPRTLPDAVDRLSERVHLTYQVSHPRDGKIHAVRVTTSRPGLTVRAPRQVASVTPEAMSAVRARTLLGAEQAGGEIPINAQVVEDTGTTTKPDEWIGRVDIDMDVAELHLTATDEPVDLRVTLALALPDGRIYVSQQAVKDQDLSRAGRWSYSIPLRLPAGTQKLSVVVDELAYGRWGGAVSKL